MRIATVTTICLATVAAFIGAAGLGAPIFNAIQTGFKTEFVAAGLLAIALALVADVLLVLVQRLLTPWARRPGGLTCSTLERPHQLLLNNPSLSGDKTLGAPRASFAAIGVAMR